MSSIPDVRFVMFKGRNRFLQSPLVPTSIAARAKEGGPLIVVDSMYGPASRCKMLADR
jgi:hypothetical protein